MKPLDKAVGKVKKSWQSHRERHRPSGFGLALADSIHYLDAGTWDALTSHASIFLSRSYLEVLEAQGPANVQPRYALIFRGREPVAALAAQSVVIQASRLPKAPPSTASLEKLEQRVLVCGNLLSWGPHGVALAPGEDPGALWPAVAEALYRIRRADRLRGKTDLVIVKDLPEDHQVGMDALERFSYRPLETEPDMVLNIDPAWRCYDDYLASLTAKYRKAAKKIRKGVEKAGYSVEKLADVESHADILHALYLEVHEQQKMRLATLTPDFLPALSSRLGERMNCLVVRDGEQILGFVVILFDGDSAVGYFLGHHRLANRQTPIYLRLLQAVIEEAIVGRVRRLSLGRSALEPKARLGARPAALRVWVRHRVPVLNLVVRGLLHGVHHDEPPERQPFTESRGG